MTEKKYNSDFYNGYGWDIGELDIDVSSRSGGKKILDWKFKAAGSNKVTPVTVSIVRDSDFESGDVGLKFEASCGMFASPMIDTDIDNLRKRVESYLIEQASLISRIHWEDWFEVVAKGANSDFDDSKFSALGANLHIQVNRLKRGIHPDDGRPVTIYRNGAVVDMPKSASISSEHNPPGIGDFLAGRPEERSYIPATPENRKALDDLLARMSELRRNLSEFLSQENVISRLSTVASCLPAPPTDKKVVEARKEAKSDEFSP